MDLVNRAIQYDRRCTEKPFFLNRRALSVWLPSFNAAPMHMALQHMSSSELHALILGRSNVAPSQIPHQIINARRYLCSPLERRGTSESRCDGRRDRIHMRSIDQHKPVASTGIGNRWIIGDRLGQRRVARDQMYGDDSV